MTRREFLGGVGCLAVAVALGAARSASGVTPWDEMWQRPVSPQEGVTVRAYALESPRLMKAYVVRIDLGMPGIGFTATERSEHWGEPMPDYTNRTFLIDTKREKTADFMMRRRSEGLPVAVAVNASPWGPWDCSAAYRTKYGSFPRWNVSGGVELSQRKDPGNGAFFLVYKDGRVDIASSVPPSRTNDVAYALSGFGLLMTNGVPFAPYVNRTAGRLSPCTAFGLTADRRALVLLVVDGRQPDYSLGAEKRDLCELLRAEGVADAVEMDGGGSSSLVVYDREKDRPKMLNHHANDVQRANALNFGIIMPGVVRAGDIDATTLSAKGALIPMPREVKATGGECRKSDAPKAEVVATIPPEGYELSVTPDGVTIRHSDDAGLFYATMTLRELRDGAADGALPCVEIKDAPAFRWRGVHLDEARHFFGKAAVKRVLEEMSWYKFNVFHWHLTDSQAWVLDVPGYPKLVRQGKGKEFGEKIGPFHYTERDVKEILDYAAARQITVVPEIDFPGHFAAACRAYPDLACQGGGKVMCVGNTNAVAFAEKVLDYVCELFPSRDIHIGGDECPRKFWAKCPRCRALVEREGLKDAEDIQPWLTRRLAAYLEAKGRRSIGWEEIVVGRGKADANGESENKDGAKSSLLPEKNVLVMGYHKAAAAKSANMGYTVVSCPNWHCYFDYTQQLEDDPFNYFLPKGRWLPLEAVYRFDPFEGVEPERRANILGGQCCNWTEKTTNLTELEWKMWPRGLALAEILWTNPDPAKRDFAEFSTRAAEHRRRLIHEHVNCAPLK